ncbi:MAG: hypothetical protein OXE94_07625 [Aestuariivita sp.]|nr:hypothetical protein [Aestuariivita sp.]MCY4202249.1 hypothetical protein [Aestuariivita sp.]
MLYQTDVGERGLVLSNGQITNQSVKRGETLVHLMVHPNHNFVFYVPHSLRATTNFQIIDAASILAALFSSFGSNGVLGRT